MIRCIYFIFHLQQRPLFFSPPSACNPPCVVLFYRFSFLLFLFFKASSFCILFNQKLMLTYHLGYFIFKIVIKDFASSDE
jgi:hypothetical protein